MTFNDEQVQNSVEDLRVSKEKKNGQSPAISIVKQKKTTPSVPKVSCYQCYKLFYIKDDEEFKQQAQQMRSSKGLKVSGISKMFCSVECERKYNSVYSKTCALETCKKEFLKENGVTAHTRWFCCEDHASSDPKTQKLD